MAVAGLRFPAFFTTCFSPRPSVPRARGRQVLCESQLTNRYIAGAQHTSFSTVPEQQSGASATAGFVSSGIGDRVRASFSTRAECSLDEARELGGGPDVVLCDVVTESSWPLPASP